MTKDHEIDIGIEGKFVTLRMPIRVFAEQMLQQRKAGGWQLEHAESWMRSLKAKEPDTAALVEKFIDDIDKEREEPEDPARMAPAGRRAGGSSSGGLDSRCPS